MILALSVAPALAQERELAPAPPPDEATLRGWAGAVEDHNAALSAIWPTYWPEGQPFILHAPGTGAVFGGIASPDGTARFQAEDLPGDDFTFQLHHPAGPPHTIAVRAENTSDLQLMFHEQFHDYQTQTFGWSRGGTGEYVDLSLIPDLAAFIAATDLERRLLVQALQTDDRSEKRRLVRLFNTLRQTRHNALDPSIGASEDYHEWIEGTAEYVGSRGAAILAEDAALARRKIVDLLQTPTLDRPGALVTRLFRARSYGVGSAQAQLLADLNAVRWQDRVESGFTLATLLDNAVGRAPADEALAWIQQNDLPALTEQARQALAVHPSPILSAEDFLANAPYQLVIELPLTTEQLAALHLSFQSEGMTPLADEALALPDAARFLAQLPGVFDLVIRDQPILYEPLAEPGVQRITVLLADLTGLEALTPGSAIDLTSPSIDLTVAGAARIGRTPTEIRVRLSSE